MMIDFVTGVSLAVNLVLGCVAFAVYRTAVQAKDAALQSARAADRQAVAAEEQVKAIPAQLAAANLAASAAQQQADFALQTAIDAKKLAQLTETQLNLSLRPFVEFERRPPSLRDPLDYIVNRGTGIALRIRVGYGTNVPPPPTDIPSMLTAKGESITRIDWARVRSETVVILYESEDGRKFRTVVGVTNSWHPTNTHEQIG